MDDLASAVSSGPAYQTTPGPNSGYGYAQSRSQKPKWLVPVIIASIVVVGLVIAWQSGVIGGKVSGMTYDEFKATLGLDKEAQVRLGKSEIINRIGNPDRIIISGQDAVVYYKVRGGMVVMEVNTFEWNQERGRKYVFLRIDKLTYAGE